MFAHAKRSGSDPNLPDFARQQNGRPYFEQPGRQSGLKRAEQTLRNKHESR
jgi:hypothetical protein